VVTHTHFLFLREWCIFHILPYVFEPHFFQDRLESLVINDTADVFEKDGILFASIWRLKIFNADLLIEELKLVDFDDKWIPDTPWDVDYFQYPVCNSDFIQRLWKCEFFAILKKVVKYVSRKVVKRFINRRLVAFIQTLKSTRLLLQKHSILTKVLVLFISSDSILIHECLISAVQRVNILLVVMGDLVVVSHYLVPRSEIVLLQRFWVVGLEFNLYRGRAVAYKSVGRGFFSQEQYVQLVQEMLIF
jgi:hypothetical protein